MHTQTANNQNRGLLRHGKMFAARSAVTEQETLGCCNRERERKRGKEGEKEKRIVSQTCRRGDCAVWNLKDKVSRAVCVSLSTLVPVRQGMMLHSAGDQMAPTTDGAAQSTSGPGDREQQCGRSQFAGETSGAGSMRHMQWQGNGSTAEHNWRGQFSACSNMQPGRSDGLNAILRTCTRSHWPACGRDGPYLSRGRVRESLKVA